MELFQQLNGCCPYCGKEVNIVEGMVYDYTLNKEGNPHFLNSEEYRVAGYCKTCSKCLYVAPNNRGGYTVYPDNNAIPIMLRKVYSTINPQQRTSALGIRLLESESNPFTNIEDDLPF